MEFDPPIGRAETVDVGIRRIVAPNPSPMTYRGTNTYLLGEQKLFLIDPGPDDPDHLAGILDAIGDAKLEFIFITHSHLDHSPLAAPLSKITGAPVLAFGDSSTGRSEIMQRLAETGMIGGGEGVDPAFRPDKRVSDGEIFATNEWQLELIHTPGHMGNHMVIRWGDKIFTGDLVMGWASSLVSPPDGDLADFLKSCEKLKSRQPKILYPGHGAPVSDAVGRIDWLVSHRKERTVDILTSLAAEPQTIKLLTQTIYSDIDTKMHPAAARNIFAHLVDLHQRLIVKAEPALDPNATFALQPK
jgi:glyoxylase-like metal-dependent hydrolase (beta-lactamase superfamily II)